MSSMNGLPADRSLATRESLLRRLQDCDDQASWQEFYETYRDLIYRFALKAGCTETEAEEVVQETVIGVARKLPEFKYDRAVCAFKTWLLNLTIWRVKDQFRKRAPAGRDSQAVRPASRNPGEPSHTGTVERIADPAANPLEAVWNNEWQQTVTEMAIQRLKERANLKDCQILDLYVRRQWSASDVARALGVSVARVYLAKHRLVPLLKKEIRELEQQLR